MIDLLGAIMRRLRAPGETVATTPPVVKLRLAATPDSAYLWVRLRRDLTLGDFPDGAAPAPLPVRGDVILLDRAAALNARRQYRKVGVRRLTKAQKRAALLNAVIRQAREAGP